VTVGFGLEGAVDGKVGRVVSGGGRELDQLFVLFDCLEVFAVGLVELGYAELDLALGDGAERGRGVDEGELEVLETEGNLV